MRKRFDTVREIARETERLGDKEKKQTDIESERREWKRAIDRGREKEKKRETNQTTDIDTEQETLRDCLNKNERESVQESKHFFQCKSEKRGD